MENINRFANYLNVDKIYLFATLFTVVLVLSFLLGWVLCFYIYKKRSNLLHNENIKGYNLIKELENNISNLNSIISSHNETIKRSNTNETIYKRINILDFDKNRVELQFNNVDDNRLKMDSIIQLSYNNDENEFLIPVEFWEVETLVSELNTIMTNGKNNVLKSHFVIKEILIDLLNDGKFYAILVLSDAITTFRLVVTVPNALLISLKNKIPIYTFQSTLTIYSDSSLKEN